VDDVVQRKADERHRNLIINMIVESLGVSRQAVSKWESDASDLSTTHLIVLSKLFGASTEELLKRAQYLPVCRIQQFLLCVHTFAHIPPNGYNVS